MSHKCPTCQRVLYDRRLKACGVCGAPIPEEMQFTAGEIAALDEKMAEWKEQRLQRERAAEKEAEEKRQRDGRDTGIDFPG